MPKVSANLDFQNGPKILNLPDPTLAQDAATKAYADALVTAAVEGIKHKAPVRVRTTANVNLASPGASLDGVALSAGDRWYADGQTTAAQKGLYIWNGAATPATRAPDASTFTELVNALITVAEGTDAGKVFRQTVATGTIDVTAPVLAAFGSVAGAATETAAGIAEIATQAEVNAGSDDVRFITALKLANWTGRKFKAIATIGDGAATQYDVTHNLGTREITVSVRLAANDEHVICDLRSTDDNTLRLNFAVAPALNAIKVAILG